MHGTTKCTDTPTTLLKIDSAYPAIWACVSAREGIMRLLSVRGPCACLDV